MKKNLMVIILALFLVGASLASAEGLLPSLTDTIGKPMPSLGEALGRYPDDEASNANGSNTEVFQSVTETDFNTFSVYLSEQGASLADYQASDTSFSASIQVKGKSISFTYNTLTLEATVTYPNGTYDEWLDYAKTQFADAVQLLDAGKTDEAVAVLFSIPEYSRFKPIAEYFAKNPELATAAHEAKLAPYKTVGNYVIFGTYPQTDSGTDSTPIEWLILDYDAKSKRTLLISRYGLDAKQYHPDNLVSGTTWETCTLRTWLNDDFLNKAFSTQEQSAILLTNLDNSGRLDKDTTGGNDTQDRVFLLSYAEIKKYFEVKEISSFVDNVKLQISPTDYVSGYSYWWLRSPHNFQYMTACITATGAFVGCVHASKNLVRPAFWLDLESDFFRSEIPI